MGRGRRKFLGFPRPDESLHTWNAMSILQRGGFGDTFKAKKKIIDGKIRDCDNRTTDTDG